MLLPAKNSIIVMRAFLVYICQLDYYTWAMGRLTVRRAWEGPELCHLDMAQSMYARACVSLMQHCFVPQVAGTAMFIDAFGSALSCLGPLLYTCR